MKKDVAYSMRMNGKVREALRKAAEIECRTVASLLDKIVTDYLTREGFLTGSKSGTERRRFPRKQMTVPAKTFLKERSGDGAFPCVVIDISMGGVLVTYPKGANIRFTSKGELPHFEICIELPWTAEELLFDCTARHMRDTGNEIQVGAIFSNPAGACLQKLSSYIM